MTNDSEDVGRREDRQYLASTSPRYLAAESRDHGGRDDFAVIEDFLALVAQNRQLDSEGYDPEDEPCPSGIRRLGPDEAVEVEWTVIDRWPPPTDSQDSWTVFSWDEIQLRDAIDPVDETPSTPRSEEES